MRVRSISHHTRLFSVAFAVTLSLSLAMAQQSPARPNSSEATLPLAEILRLYRESDEAKKKIPKPTPPVAAAIHRLDLRGRLLDSAVDLTAKYEIVVLSDDDWVRVPLLQQDPQTHLSALPEVADAAFVVENGELAFLTRRKGTYKFSLSFLKQAEQRERRRTVLLRHGAATLALCHVAFDQGIFRLTSSELVERADGALLFPEDGTFTIAWERTGAVEVKKDEAARPAIESVIPVAHASTVSTLEGTRITRLRYQLRFAGKKPIELEMPRGTTVERAYLNGASVPVDLDPQERTFKLEVAPTREGDEAGVLELVLSTAGGGYYLSGSLEVELPRVSWPVNRLFLDVHLPQVFNYRWSGGSLSPAESSAPVQYAYEVPLPGKKMSFHQPLISSSAPDVTLDYAVDLEGHYFRP